jgi:hypothetical protein
MDTWVRDYLAVCRAWGRAQRHCEQAQREWAADRAALQAEIVRLRGQLLVLQTGLLWGMRSPGLLLHTRRQTAASSKVRDAREAWCQTACHGNAHPWLAEDGHCRLHGGDCPSARVTLSPVRAPHGTADSDN